MSLDTSNWKIKEFQAEVTAGAKRRNEKKRDLLGNST